jgi:adenylate cyclase
MPEKDQSEWWFKYLTEGHRVEGFARVVFPLLPTSPRCKVCYVPFGGAGQALKYLGWAPSRKNPRLCTWCCERLPPGGAEVEIAVLVADVRGYTSLSEKLADVEVARLMNRFYKMAIQLLVEYDALIDKFMGDSVLALFVPGIAGPDYRVKAVNAAEALLRGIGYGTTEGPWLPMGIGVQAGPAFVGNVGDQAVVDLTAIGDTVNVASRIQGQAGAGEILLGEEVYSAIEDQVPGLERRTLTLKGKQGPVAVRVLPGTSATI